MLLALLLAYVLLACLLVGLAVGLAVGCQIQHQRRRATPRWVSSPPPRDPGGGEVFLFFHVLFFIFVSDVY